MKVNLVKPVHLIASDAKVYDLPAGEQAVHDSLLGALVDQHLDAIDQKYITALQDRIFMVKASTPAVNTSRPTGVYQNVDDIDDMDTDLPPTKTVGLPTATGEDSLVSDNGTTTDKFGNVINKQATVTTPAAGLGQTKVETVGKANPRLITTNDTVQSKVDQTAKSNQSTSTSGNGNGSKSSSDTSNGGNKSASTASTMDTGTNK